MQEKFPYIKANNPELPSKDIIATVAKLWKDLGSDEKNKWKEKAHASHEDDGCEEEGAASRSVLDKEYVSSEGNEGQDEEGNHIEDDKVFHEDHHHKESPLLVSRASVLLHRSPEQVETDDIPQIKVPASTKKTTRQVYQHEENPTNHE